MMNYPIGNRQWTVDRSPENCPICHRSIDPRYLTGVVLRAPGVGSAEIELVFQCPHHECLHSFIATYVGPFDHGANDFRPKLRAVAPFVPRDPVHPSDISDLSPQFSDIYRQAAASEAWHLTDVAGCGYRKALEYLVKDYCVSTHPESAEAIRSKLLGQVISEYIADVNIQECARRAAWLGNDETHYVRRWNDRDIGDLKALIALTESWINSHLLTQRYLRDR